MSDRVVAVFGRGVVDPTEPVVRGDDLGLTRGDGIFETLRTHRGKPFLLAEHVDRMRASADRMALATPSQGEWAALVDEALAAYGTDDGVLRLYTTRGPDGEETPFSYLLVSPVPQLTIDGRERGTHAITLPLGISASVRAAAPWLLGGVKTTSYAVAMAAKRVAEERGAHDAIWVSTEGEVLEEATSSVVWLQGGSAYTVPIETGILPGTTFVLVRKLAAERGVEIADRRALVDELREADEVMFLSSVRGVAPVLSVDASPIGDGTVGPVTRLLRDAFEAAAAAATR